MNDAPRPSTRRWAWVIAGVILLIYVVALPATVVHGGVTCGGDGGSPYAAPASPRGRFCESGALPVLLLLIAPGTVLAGGLVAIRRQNRRLLQIGIAVGIVVLLVGVFVPGMLSKDCANRPESMTPDEFQAYQNTDCGHY